VPFYAKISHNNYVAPPKSPSKNTISDTKRSKDSIIGRGQSSTIEKKNSIIEKDASTIGKQASKSASKEETDKDAAADGKPSVFDSEKYKVPEFLKFEQIKNRFGLEKGFVPPRVDDGDKDSEASSDGSKKAVDVVEMLALEEGRVEQQILDEFRNEADSVLEDRDDDGEQPYDNINMHQKLIEYDLGGTDFHKDFKDHKFWIKIAQKKMKEEGNLQLGIDFLRNGLRYIPKNPELLYNYACANERIGKYQVAVKFFNYANKMKLNWSDALYGQSIAHFKLKQYSAAERCAVKAVKCYNVNDSLETIDVMIYFKAMCYKRIGNYALAKRDYESLIKIF